MGNGLQLRQICRPNVRLYLPAANSLIVSKNQEDVDAPQNPKLDLYLMGLNRMEAGQGEESVYRHAGLVAAAAVVVAAAATSLHGSYWADTSKVASPSKSSDVARPSARPPTATLLEVELDGRKWRGMEFGRVSDLLLLLTQDGQIHRFVLGKQAKVRAVGQSFEPLNLRELELGLREEFGPKFKTIRTAHYLICHNTHPNFARETADLVEQLYRTFTAYFGARGLGFSKPQFPMVVIVFDDEGQFRDYLASAPGISTITNVTGIYSVYSNRIALFNAAGREAEKYGDTRWHNLSTVIHEATHQIAFNSGCHHRFADTPAWLVEGLAMYFETPDVQGQEIVWKSAGKMNRPRLDRFLKYQRKNRGQDSIVTLVQDDQRFRSDATVSDAYAESWALTYFLVNRRMPQFLKYVKLVASKRSLEQDTPEERLADFQNCFGSNLRLLDASFLRFVDEL